MRPNPRLRPILLAAVFMTAAASCGSSTTTSSEPSPTEGSAATPTDEATQTAPTAASRNGHIPDFEDSLAIDNPYLPFSRRGRWLYEGTNDGASYRVEVEVTDETRVVAWRDDTGEYETETMIVRHRGWVDGELVEETLDYYAAGSDESVWYFGEDVDNYEAGEVIDHDGSWLAGANGALPALLMPGEPEEGQVFYSEDIAERDIVEQNEVLATDVTVETPDGQIEDGLLIGGTQPDGTEEEKIYAPDIGEVLARSDEG